ncbi:flagellar protein FliT [Pseudomaricurvus alkylphenolicus]|uniref:Wadjet anti-phage system protein JetA family protein n=1 Tax=Pseudomaricurvus alkylphenolicus TaxID=1306991 RepID=UPI001421D736|nr:Wadjet anti-phage system protein JetA family protein [Pseudomaricurvus alkylphenolicus]NIB43723.1 flagellar protein FliT [Pseudomaricurvus alkylphenolicus]
MFFTQERQQFFKPLTGKYREVLVECLRLLYQRLYTDLTDFGHVRDREQLVEIFQEAIARAPVLDAEPETEEEGRFKNQRELAGFVINTLLDYGWLEKQVDEASLQSTFAFTKVGRLFTQPFIENDQGRFRTRNRNTRNTRNSLQAFLEQGEVHDLLDAYEYSERIISDFTDVIAELEERKRLLVREVEARELIVQASDEFFEFMENTFKPDLEVRLSADSVEKYRDQIETLIRQIRRKRKYGGEAEDRDRDWRAVMEQRLRRLLPGSVVQGQSILENLLTGIEERLRSACEGMLPALRRSLNNFTQRADIIMRQLSYIHAQGDDGLLETCRLLSEQPQQQQDRRLCLAGEQLASLNMGYLDPSQIQLRQRSGKRVVNSRVEDERQVDKNARRELFIQQALDNAFSIQSGDIRGYVIDALKQTGRINSRHLPINDARQLLAAAHSIAVASADNRSSEYRLMVTAASADSNGAQWLPLDARVRDELFFTSRDEFIIELVESEASALD